MDDAPKPSTVGISGYCAALWYALVAVLIVMDLWLDGTVLLLALIAAPYFLLQCYRRLQGLFVRRMKDGA